MLVGRFGMVCLGLRGVGALALDTDGVACWIWHERYWWRIQPERGRQLCISALLVQPQRTCLDRSFCSSLEPVHSASFSRVVLLLS